MQDKSGLSSRARWAHPTHAFGLRVFGIPLYTVARNLRRGTTEAVIYCYGNRFLSLSLSAFAASSMLPPTQHSQERRQNKWTYMLVRLDICLPASLFVSSSRNRYAKRKATNENMYQRAPRVTKNHHKRKPEACMEGLRPLNQILLNSKRTVFRLM